MLTLSMTPETQPQCNTPPATQNENTQQNQPLLLPTPAQPNLTNPNTLWGDVVHLQQPHDFFHVLSKNVGTLKNTTSLDMLAIATGLKELNTSTFLAQEMNTPWNPKNLQNLVNQCHQVYPHK